MERTLSSYLLLPEEVNRRRFRMGGVRCGAFRIGCCRSVLSGTLSTETGAFLRTHKGELLRRHRRLSLRERSIRTEVEGERVGCHQTQTRNKLNALELLMPGGHIVIPEN